MLSPAGKKIAFRKMLGESNSEVFVADADGSNPQNISNNPAFDGWPAWSPDGTMIAFASNRGNQNYQIYTMHPDGSDVRLVAATEGRATAPKWSPDGKTIYFTFCAKARSLFGPLTPLRIYRTSVSNWCDACAQFHGLDLMSRLECS